MLQNGPERRKADDNLKRAVDMATPWCHGSWAASVLATVGEGHSTAHVQSLPAELTTCVDLGFATTLGHASGWSRCTCGTISDCPKVPERRQAVSVNWSRGRV